MAPNISARRRSWRWKPRMALSRRVCLPTDRLRLERRSVSRSTRRGFRSLTGNRDALSGRACTTEDMVANVTLNGVTKSFGETRAVTALDLCIANGEFVVLLGPTGAGKTTTLRLIAGLERPDTGTIAIAGRDVTRLEPATRDVAFVFQQYSLYPHLSVYENLAFPLRS